MAKERAAHIYFEADEIDDYLLRALENAVRDNTDAQEVNVTLESNA